MGGEVRKHGPGVHMSHGRVTGVMWKRKGTLMREEGGRKSGSEKGHKEEDVNDRFFLPTFA